MPRSPASVSRYNRRYETKRAVEYVRGPRITREASEKLRDLSYQMRMNPCDVVSVLLLEQDPDKRNAARLEFQKRERLSDAEMAALDSIDFATHIPAEHASPAATGTTSNVRTSP